MKTRTLLTRLLVIIQILGLCQIASPDAEAGLFHRRSHGKSGRHHSKTNPKIKNPDRFIQEMRRRAESLSRQGFPYVFGGSSPADGGMDCSGTIKYLLSGLGFQNMPRTSYNQYEWLKANHTMHHTKTIPAKMGGRGGLKPGNLIFWGGTYNSGHKVSHVMIYLGQSPEGKHYMFGARGKKKKGLNGSGIDIFELRSGKQKSLIGYGRLPGLR